MVFTLLQTTLDSDPSLALLNHVSTDYKSQICLLLQLTMAAKQTIVRAWKTPTLNVAEVKNRITQAMIHGKIEATILDCIPQHLKIWHPWVENFLPPDFEGLLEL